MEELISKVLNRCGYGFMEPTEKSLIECFLDYCDHGVFKELDVEEAQDLINDGEITIKMICNNLMSVR
jgi:hypothetical protein